MIGILVAELALVSAIGTAGATGAASAESGLVTCRLELEGPLRRVLLRGAGGVVTEIVCELAPGERRAIRVPTRADLRPGFRPQVELVEPDEGRVQIAERSGEGGSGGDRAWAELPFGLRSRSRPPAAAVRPAPGIAPAALLLATCLAVGGWRRRAPLVAAGCALLATLLAAIVPLHRKGDDPATGGPVVWEGEGGGTTWLRVRAGRGEIQLSVDFASGDRSPPRLECEPAEAGLRWLVELDAAGGSRWTASARDALLHLVEIERARGSLSRSANELGDLSACWTRSTDGRWQAHGRWPRGGPLPPILETPSGRPAETPPGWLASGLPQAVEVLLGRLEPRSPGESPWVRVIPF